MATMLSDQRVSLALLHYPVLDRHGELYTTAITNMDVHDISRSSCTYGLDQYYVVSPIKAQQEMASTIANFWVNGSGLKRNTDRSRALSLVSIEEDLAACVARETEILGHKPLLIATSAKRYARNISYAKGREIVKSQSAIILFGTGFGLAESIVDLCDYVLDPIDGPTDYNHLSVRSAVAIILDRLFHG